MCHRARKIRRQDKGKLVGQPILEIRHGFLEIEVHKVDGAAGQGHREGVLALRSPERGNEHRRAFLEMRDDLRLARGGYLMVPVRPKPELPDRRRVVEDDFRKRKLKRFRELAQERGPREAFVPKPFRPEGQTP